MHTKLKNYFYKLFNQEQKIDSKNLFYKLENVWFITIEKENEINTFPLLFIKSDSKKINVYCDISNLHEYITEKDETIPFNIDTFLYDIEKNNQKNYRNAKISFTRFLNLEKIWTNNPKIYLPEELKDSCFVQKKKQEKTIEKNIVISRDKTLKLARVITKNLKQKQNIKDDNKINLFSKSKPSIKSKIRIFK